MNGKMTTLFPTLFASQPARAIDTDRRAVSLIDPSEELPPASVGGFPWFWRLQAVAWGLVFAVNVGLSCLLPVPVPVWILLMRSAVACLASTAIHPLCQAVYHRRPPLALFVPMVMALAFAAVALSTLVTHLILHAVGLSEVLRAYDDVLPLLYGLKFVTMLVWITAWFALKNRQQAGLVDRLHREARLKLLRQQVDPHFLFNALNSIAATADDPAKVTGGIDALSKYLRFSLRHSGATCPLREELTAMEDYLAVEKLRFEDAIDVRVEVDPAARDVTVPPAIVQPLVENAIKYGNPSPGDGVLSVRVGAAVSDGTLEIVVENSGPWVGAASPARRAKDPLGTGLGNLRQRLAMIYGGTATLTVDHDPDHVRVTVGIPLGPSP